MEITRSSTEGATTKRPAEWFTGDVYIDPVASVAAPSRVQASLVHFMPGARTAWHHHPLGQTLFVTEGIGRCQRRGGPVEVIHQRRRGRRHMARIFITGSADGLGRAAAQTVLGDGHEVIVHARSPERLAAVNDLIGRGASAVVGDLADFDQTQAVADQVNQLGRVDAVIHNAGIYSGPQVMPVNVVAPYVLTALIHRPQRLVYLSSGSHHGGRADLAGLDWSGQRRIGSYSDSKLFVTTLAVAVSRIWPDVYSNAVDPGWVPTKMGGPGAPDDLRLGHLTQEWLATSNEPKARSSGGYWFHQRLRIPHPAVNDMHFQEELLDALAQFTGVPLA